VDRNAHGAIVLSPPFPVECENSGVRLRIGGKRAEIAYSIKPGVTMNRPEEAGQATRRAIQLDPQSIEAHYLIGFALLMPRARAYLEDVQSVLSKSSRD